MNVLWIVNSPIGPIAKKLDIKSSSGTWLTAALREIDFELVNLFIACCISNPEEIIIKNEGITYIAIGGHDPYEYNVNEKSINAWNSLFNRINPDIIHIWGTEYSHSLAALKGKPNNIPALVYIQGVMKSVSDNYYGDLDIGVLGKYTSIIERIAKKTIYQAKRRIDLSAKNEIEVIKLADGIIYETDWSLRYYSKLNEGITCFRHKLPIDSVFGEYHWTIKEYIEHTIFTPASDYPLKGVHHLIQAVAKVKEIYPDVKLIVPGAKVPRDSSLIDKMKQKAYRRYLRDLISTNRLWENIEFTGVLSPSQMADHMKRANVFVCASSIENHSSTLREAMLVGTPCITTNVGGIPEIFVNNVDGLMYSPNDVENLSNQIIQIFKDKLSAERFSKNAHDHILEYYSDKSQSLMDIYNGFIVSIHNE